MINQSCFGSNRKVLISILLGFFSLMVSPYGFSTTVANIIINIPWSLVIPVVISLAFGWRYGVISGVSGAALFPFLLWPNNGYANVGTSLIFLINYFLIGVATDAKIWKQNQNLAARLALALVFGTSLFWVYDSFLFNKLLALSPPFWTKEILLNLSQQLLYTFAVKDSINIIILVFISETLLRIPLIRRVFGLPVDITMADNPKIFLATMLLAIIAWVVFLSLDFLLIINENNFVDGHDVVAFMVIITSGFFASRTLFYYSEKQIEGKIELKNSEALHRLLTDNSTDMIARHNAFGDFQYVSQACNALLGYNQEDLIGHKFVEFIHPEDILGAAQSLTRKVDQPIFSTTEFRMRCKNGKYLWLETMSHFVTNSKTGELMEIHSASRDITNRKLADFALLESKANLAAIIENTLDSILSVNKQYEITYMNAVFQHSFLARFGVVLKVGMNILSAIPGPLQSMWKSYYDRALNNEHFIFEDAIDLGFSVLYQEVAMNPIVIEGQVIGASFFSRDITSRRMAELKLKESESKFKALYDNANDAIFLLKDGLFIECNPNALAMFGCSLAQIIGKSPAFFSPPFQPDGMNSQDKALKLISLAAANKPQKFEWQHTRLDGTLFDAEVLLNRVVINKELLLQVIVRNITERKQSELTLRESESRYKAITDGLTDYLYTVLVEDGRVVDTIHSEACLAVTGYSASELQADKLLWYKMIYNDDREVAISKFQSVLEGNSTVPFEHRIFCKDGTVRWLSNTVIPKYDATGKMIAYDGVIKDITDRKQSEFLRFEALEKLEKISSSVPGLVYQFRIRPDGTSCFPFASKGIEDIYRVNPEDVIEDATVVFNVIHPNDYDAVVASLKDSANRLTPWQLEYRVKFKDGLVRVHYGNALPEREADGSILWHGFITDITKHKYAEEKLRDSEVMLSDLATNVPGVIYQFFARNNGEMGFYYIGPKVNEILGMSPDKSSSEWDLGALVHPDDKADFFNAIATAISEVKEMHYEGRLLTTKGVVWIQILSRPMVKKDEIIFNGIILNITERKLDEDKLRESERVLRESQAVGHIGSYITDLKTSEWQATTEIEKIFGIYENQDYPHTLEGWTGFIHPDSREELFAYHQEVVKQRKRFEHTYQIVRINDGESRWVQGTGELEYDSNNEPIKMLGVIQDITERKQAEDALRSLATSYANLSGKAFFEAVASHIAEAMKLDYVFVGELKDKTSINVLGGCAKGLPMGEMSYSLRNTPCQNVIGAKVCTYSSGVQALFPEDKLLVDMGVESYLGAPLFGKDQEGLGILVALHSKPLQNAETISDYFKFFVERISAELQRLRAEEQRRKSEEKLSALFGSMAEMVMLYELVYDENGQAVNYRITDCNNAYTEITGIAKEAALGKLATELFDVDVPPYLQEYVNVAITGHPYEHTNYFAPLDKHFMVSVVSPSKNTFATITTDITSMSQIQEAITAKNEELENYLYVTSHDLRSPLVNIQGFSQRLQKQANIINAEIARCPYELEAKDVLNKVINQDIPKTLDFIFTNVTKMDTLINGLLQISRTGRIKMSVKKINVNHLINTIIAALNFQLTEHGVVLNVGILPECYGDEGLLNQLFSNIIGNALKYYDKNRPLVIEIGATMQHRRVVYSIKDNGIGISPKHLKKIWDVFYRVDSSAPEAGEGIGLSLVKRITDKHKGKIWVESTEGVGTTFFVGLRKDLFTE